MREKMVHTLTRAAEAYDRKRYEEALRLGRIVADATPGVAAVRELTGLAAYRAERWAMAKIHLRAYFTITEPTHYSGGRAYLQLDTRTPPPEHPEAH